MTPSQSAWAESPSTSRRTQSWSCRHQLAMAPNWMMGEKQRARKGARRVPDQHHMIGMAAPQPTINTSLTARGRVQHGMISPTRGTIGLKKMDIALQTGRAPTVARDSTGPQHRWLLREPIMASPMTNHPSRGEGCPQTTPPSQVESFYSAASKVLVQHRWPSKQWWVSLSFMCLGNATQNAFWSWRSTFLMQFIEATFSKMMQQQWPSWCSTMIARASAWSCRWVLHLALTSLESEMMLRDVKVKKVRNSHSIALSVGPSGSSYLTTHFDNSVRTSFSQTGVKSTSSHRSWGFPPSLWTVPTFRWLAVLDFDGAIFSGAHSRRIPWMVNHCVGRVNIAFTDCTLIPSQLQCRTWTLRMWTSLRRWKSEQHWCPASRHRLL